VFVLGSQTHLVTAYLLPGVFVGGLLSRMIPSKFVYWIEPEGGPAAFLLLALLGSFAIWSTLFSALYHYRRAFRGSSQKN
jgi:uncharacterized membrane protein YraQ (UPF0718 family)